MNGLRGRYEILSLLFGDYRLAIAYLHTELCVRRMQITWSRLIKLITFRYALRVLLSLFKKQISKIVATEAF